MRELPGLAKFGYFCVGLFGGLPGVLAAWFMGKDGWGWSEGGKRFAWLGCLFFLVLGAVMVLTGAFIEEDDNENPHDGERDVSVNAPR